MGIEFVSQSTSLVLRWRCRSVRSQLELNGVKLSDDAAQRIARRAASTLGESPVEAPEAGDKIEVPVPAQEWQRMLAAERGDP